jgi:PleD family two-component response regulator
MSTNSSQMDQTDKTDRTDTKTVLVAVTDIFFYTKVRDALLRAGYQLEKARMQGEITDKATACHPVAVVLNMNDEIVDAFQALESLKADPRLATIPTLAFANHEEVDTWNRAKALGVTKIVSRNEFSARTNELVEAVIAVSGQRSAASRENA